MTLFSPPLQIESMGFLEDKTFLLSILTGFRHQLLVLYFAEKQSSRVDYQTWEKTWYFPVFGNKTGDTHSRTKSTEQACHRDTHKSTMSNSVSFVFSRTQLEQFSTIFLICNLAKFARLLWSLWLDTVFCDTKHYNVVNTTIVWNKIQRIDYIHEQLKSTVAKKRKKKTFLRKSFERTPNTEHLESCVCCAQC